MNLLQDAFEQANGFSSLTSDELFFINGGCGHGTDGSGRGKDPGASGSGTGSGSGK
jgi:hypothetical protein